VAPILWRSEFRSILTQYMRRGELSFPQALKLQKKAEQLMANRERLVPSENILHLAADSLCSAYDCEFVALAVELGIPLVTADKKILKAFPAIAMSPTSFTKGGA
jgi:predicted nucleic acid-binding protein